MKELPPTLPVKYVRVVFHLIKEVGEEKCMISIQNNLLAMNANNYFKINSKDNRRSTEKLSSGYRINRAADDAAGLTISEKMRRQIRGLMQGTSNAQDGISFVQVADGAMEEVHSMLQRMNELALKSLNGTYTDSERAALNAEFDQIRAEIDRISGQTQYNEQPVFEEHEDSYYQIVGSRRWNDNQIHVVPALNNELNIHLPADYDPSDYTLTVPAGTYTTQELIDEIDTAFEKMNPSNPGFVFEYTDHGICKLNFERSDGMPTEIASVDGSLSYLLFDSYSGSSSSTLLGTTVFSAKYPLTIKLNENDQLGFYAESAKGSNFISITIPQGEYSRSNMIKQINELLSEQPEAAGIVAKEYESSYVQITGGDSVNIIGLKGNMFKLDPKNAEIKYSSVFYDNVQYGDSSGIAASVTGKAYYYSSSITDKIYLSSANQNNVLRFKVNGAADYTEITFPEKAGGYTIRDIRDEINKQLADKGVVAEVDSEKVTYQYSSKGTTRDLMDCLKLSTTLKGSSSSLEFDRTGIYGNAYNALFCDTNYVPYKENGKTAQYVGYADLSSEFTLPEDASLTFKIDGQEYSIKDIAEITYADGDAIASELNSKLQYIGLKDKIEFMYDSGIFSINALTDDIQKIYFDTGQKNDTYDQLFARYVTYTNTPTNDRKSGTVTEKEGTTEKNTTDATAKVSIPSDKQNSDITITADTNTIIIRSYRYLQDQDQAIDIFNQTVTLSVGDYSMKEIAVQINDQLKHLSNNYFGSITCKYANDQLILEATPKGENTAGSYRIDFGSDSSAWKAIYGTSTYDAAYSIQASESTLGTRQAVTAPITVDSSNNGLTLKIGQYFATGNIDAKTYNDSQSLAEAIQNAFIGTDLEGKFTVSSTADGKLVFTSSAGNITASGSFYDDVFITRQTKTAEETKGAYGGFQDAFIIGRKDLTIEPVDIVSGANDMFTFDFTHKDSQGTEYKKEINITIPEGTYTGDEIAKALQEKIQEKFDKEKIEDFDVEVSVGGEKTGVVGAIDNAALQIKVKRKAGKEPAEGEYVIDGVRGSAAGFLFYKTTINPKVTYITGSNDLSKGVTFKPGQNVLTLSADSVPYKYTFPVNTNYTAEEFINLLNDKFANGDDNGNAAPLTASLENGNLKISHKALGSHSISDIGGNARSTLFLNENGRNYRDPIYLLVGSETKDMFEIPRTRISSCSLAINSVIISKPKYAEKAVNRIKEAITMVSSRRSTYGSVQNRLEHTINNNRNITENTQASESAIRDADIALESMEYAKSKFLMQSSQTVLAQANQQPNLVLSLLQS